MFCAKVRKNPPPNNKTEKKNFFALKIVLKFKIFTISSKENKQKNLYEGNERKVMKKIVEIFF